MAYITASEYSEITGRSELEATTHRIQYASMLLDSRIGNYLRGDDGWKLDLENLLEYKSSAVKQWVAYMVSYLYDYNDSAPSSASLSLGRFSVKENSQQGLPEQLSFADSVLVSSGLVVRGVDVK